MALHMKETTDEEKKLCSIYFDFFRLSNVFSKISGFRILCATCKATGYPF